MIKLFNTRTSDSAFTFGTLLLRLGAGSLMIVHGLDKLMHFAEKSGKFADPFGIGTTASLSLTVFAEFFCAAFIIIGLLTRLATIPLIIAMSVALFYAHGGDFFGEGSSAGLFLVCYLSILFLGPGKASVDHLIAR
jgi:putative oxidoreductase